MIDLDDQQHVTVGDMVIDDILFADRHTLAFDQQRTETIQTDAMPRRASLDQPAYAGYELLVSCRRLI